jgi:hypothetical protein
MACKEGHLQVSEETLGYCAVSNKRHGDLTIHGYETNSVKRRNIKLKKQVTTLIDHD